jgi:hypothetical protein
MLHTFSVELSISVYNLSMHTSGSNGVMLFNVVFTIRSGIREQISFVMYLAHVSCFNGLFCIAYHRLLYSVYIVEISVLLPFIWHNFKVSCVWYCAYIFLSLLTYRYRYEILRVPFISSNNRNFYLQTRSVF